MNLNSILTACSLLCPMCAAEIRYHVVYIPFGPCEECSVWPDPRDINNLNQACGHLDRYRQGVHAELWDPDFPAEVQSLGAFPGCDSGLARAAALNDAGHVVGWGSEANVCADPVACIWTIEHGIAELPRLPVFSGSFARKINNLDQIIGIQYGGPVLRGCLWDPIEGAIDLGRGPLNCEVIEPQDINDLTWITGYAYGACQGSAFLWTPQAGMTMIDGLNIAYAINNNGTVAGFRAQTSFDAEPCIWTQEDGVFGLGWLPGDTVHYAVARDINDSDTVIGEARIDGWVVGMENTSFVWTPRRGMLDLNRRRDPCNPVRELRDVLYAVAINDAGVIITVPESEYVPAALLIPYIPGDLDEDGVCDIRDLAFLLSNFGRTGASYVDGDLDCQGDVDLQDLATLLINFGDSLP